MTRSFPSGLGRDILTTPAALASAAWLAAFLFFFSAQVFPQNPQFTSSPDTETMYIDDAPDMQVIAIAKNVVVRGRAKEVFAWGGDVTVEGRVEGDVASFGGSVVQSKDGYIGGDIIVIGGAYRPEAKEPLREEGRETMMIGVFEDELREMAQDPSKIFAPSFTWSFLAQRLLSILFWFVVTIIVATLAPGAVSRASTRFQLSPLKIFGLGLLGFVLTTAGTIASVGLLPEYLSVVLAVMAFALLLLAYGFGRVAMQVSLGKYIQRNLPWGNRSESLAVLIGVIAWTILLSIPFVWTLALIALFAAGIGLVITARPEVPWKQS
jgi:hypothetical protein